MTTAIRFFVLTWLIAGCVGLKTDRDIARERAQAYLAAHPKLASNTAAAIRGNLILDGMTMEQVIAAWGQPAVVQKFREGVQYWFFGCDWPHFCIFPDRSLSSPDLIYQSRARFDNGVVVDWQI